MVNQKNMTATLADKEKILQELKNKPVGETEELKSKLVGLGLLPGMFEEVYKDLRLVGVIKQGYDGLGKRRYKRTDFGQKYCDAFLSFDEINRSLIAIINNNHLK